MTPLSLIPASLRRPKIGQLALQAFRVQPERAAICEQEQRTAAPHYL